MVAIAIAEPFFASSATWRARLRKQVAGPAQNDPVDSQKWHPNWLAPSQHDDLLFEHQDFGFQRCS
jgi:hypothetical protein